MRAPLCMARVVYCSCFTKAMCYMAQPLGGTGPEGSDQKRRMAQIAEQKTGGEPRRVSRPSFFVPAFWPLLHPLPVKAGLKFDSVTPSACVTCNTCYSVALMSKIALQLEYLPALTLRRVLEDEQSRLREEVAYADSKSEKKHIEQCIRDEGHVSQLLNQLTTKAQGKWIGW